ncbi:MAG: hypothetical protein CVU89_06165 [Firmicutes bacterium HGW-Firmicutes-14]|jgi:hypothetical protein|nr:MAG: hypothetical protein CVU89_06165 [Firmicutes bacterium HGW-Firmicutes-14]
MSGEKMLLLGTVIVLTIFGFVFGQVVNAAIGSPGSDSDPLVTKSYIDGEVGKLQTQIDTLKAEVEKLKEAAKQ